MAPLHLETFIGGEYVPARSDRRTDWSTRRPARSSGMRRRPVRPTSTSHTRAPPRLSKAGEGDSIAGVAPHPPYSDRFEDWGRPKHRDAGLKISAVSEGLGKK